MALTRQQQYALAAWRRTVGYNPEPIKISGKSLTGLCEDVSTEEIVVAGGKADSGGFRVMVGIDQQTKKPVQFDDIEAQGKTFQILNWTFRNGILFEIVAGDPVVED